MIDDREKYNETLSVIESLIRIVNGVTAAPAVFGETLLSHYVLNSLKLVEKYLESFMILSTLQKCESTSCLARVIFELIVQIEYVLVEDAAVERLDLRNINEKRKALEKLEKIEKEKEALKINNGIELSKSAREYLEKVKPVEDKLRSRGIKCARNLYSMCEIIDKKNDGGSYYFRDLYSSLYFIESGFIHSNIYSVFEQELPPHYATLGDKNLVIAGISLSMLKKVVERFFAENSRNLFLMMIKWLDEKNDRLA